jgi:1,5-anhydro-D-fructose reductase (1,5-anhydro-D-mannitol-forming)
MIRIAILSFWHVHAGDYAKQATEHADTEIIAVWDENKARGQREADRRGVNYSVWNTGAKAISSIL